MQQWGFGQCRIYSPFQESLFSNTCTVLSPCKITCSNFLGIRTWTWQGVLCLVCQNYPLDWCRPRYLAKAFKKSKNSRWALDSPLHWCCTLRSVVAFLKPSFSLYFLWYSKLLLIPCVKYLHIWNTWNGFCFPNGTLIQSFSVWLLAM